MHYNPVSGVAPAKTLSDIPLIKELVSLVRGEFLSMCGTPSGVPFRKLPMKARWDMEPITDEQWPGQRAEIERHMFEAVSSEILAELIYERYSVALRRDGADWQTLNLKGGVTQDIFDYLEDLADQFGEGSEIIFPLDHHFIVSRAANYRDGKLGKHHVTWNPWSWDNSPVLIGNGWSTWIGEEILCVPRSPTIDPNTFSPFIHFSTDVEFRANPHHYTLVVLETLTIHK